MELMQRRRVMLATQSDIPSAYRRVEWLESTGTQYIDTGIEISAISSLDTNWELMFEITNNKSVYIIAGSDDNMKQFPVVNSRLRTGDYVEEITYYYEPVIVIETNKKYVLRQESGFLSIDGESYKIKTTSNSGCHFGIFGKMYSNGSAEEYSLTEMKLYGFTANSNDTPISNLIPCYRKRDGKPGVYDTVRKVFLTNHGTGEFIVQN